MLLACVMNVPPDPKGACGRLADQHAGVSDCSGKLTRSEAVLHDVGHTYMQAHQSNTFL